MYFQSLITSVVLLNRFREKIPPYLLDHFVMLIDAISFARGSRKAQSVHKMPI